MAAEVVVGAETAGVAAEAGAAAAGVEAEAETAGAAAAGKYSISFKLTFPKICVAQARSFKRIHSSTTVTATETADDGGGVRHLHRGVGRDRGEWLVIHRTSAPDLSSRSLFYELRMQHFKHFSWNG